MVAAAVELRHFGALPDGTPVPAVELTNGAGMRACIIALGATLQSLYVPDKEGRTADVVLGHATVGGYLAQTQYFGATVGRFANRIARGKFSVDGRAHQLDVNEGPNHLHGGFRGYDKALWRLDSASGGETARVALSHVDTDGTSGYPGEVQATATYTLDDRNELTIEYRAKSDRATIVNITHHSYFNLAGEAEGCDVMDHRLTLYADAYTPIDSTSIPTGERRAVVDTPFDFRAPRAIGARIRDGRDEQLRLGRGYDHNFIVRGSPGTLRPAARLEDPASGRVLELRATAPGLQLYSGNRLDGTTVGKTGRLYRQGDGLCLEPQIFPDAPNHLGFPSACLHPGQEFVSAMGFRFLTAQ
jgi:aldose 1-epimerase